MSIKEGAGVAKAKVNAALTAGRVFSMGRMWYNSR